MESKKQS
jgi:hypothetical protein